LPSQRDPRVRPAAPRARDRNPPPGQLFRRALREALPPRRIHHSPARDGAPDAPPVPGERSGTGESGQAHDRAGRPLPDQGSSARHGCGQCATPLAPCARAGALPQGHRAARLAGGRARSHLQNARANRLEPGAGGEGVANQLPRPPLQDQADRARRRAGVSPLDLVRNTVMKHPMLCVLVGGVLLFSALNLAEPADAQAPAVGAAELDALALAGGFTQFATRSRIVILRPNGKAMTRIPFNYNKVTGGEQENFYLQNGDIVLVP